MSDANTVVVTDIPSTEPAEPAQMTGISVGVATLIVGGLVQFGLPLNAGQKAWLVGAIVLLGPIVAGWIIRSKVFSPKAVDQITQAWKTVVDQHEATIADLRAQVHVATAVAPVTQALPALVAKLPDVPRGGAPADLPPPPRPLVQEPPRRLERPLPPPPRPEAQRPADGPSGTTSFPTSGYAQTVTPEGFYDYPPKPETPPRAGEPRGYRRHAAP